MLSLYTTWVLDLDQFALFERAKFICFSISLIMKLGVISNIFVGISPTPLIYSMMGDHGELLTISLQYEIIIHKHSNTFRVVYKNAGAILREIVYKTLENLSPFVYIFLEFCVHN